MYRAGLQSICLLMLHSLAQKIKKNNKLQKEGKKPKTVFLARDYSDSSNAALRLPVLALWGYTCGCTKKPPKTRVYWCWRGQTSKTQRTSWWKRLILVKWVGSEILPTPVRVNRDRDSLILLLVSLMSLFDA